MEREDEKSSVVVIAPHPDDEVLGCGGTLYKYAQAGHQVLLYVLTDGSKLHAKTQVERRKEECLRVSQILGISHVEFLDFPDEELQNYIPSLKSALEERIKSFQKVYAPHPLDHHSDHIATSLAVISIFEEKPSFELYLYGVYNAFRYNQLVDVTDVYDIKKKALLEYAYSLKDATLMLKRVEGFMRHPVINTGEDKLYEFFFMPEKPMTLSEILGYITYDLVCQDPHTQLLKKIKSTEYLMHLLTQEKSARLSAEQTLLSQKEELERLRGYQEELDKLKASVFFRIYDLYHTKLKPKLIPEGSLRESLYKRLVKLIKGG